VRTEIETAMQRNIPVVPLLVQGAAMPGAQHLPEALAPLVYRNALPVRPNPDFARDMERVTKAIESYAPDVVFAAAPIPSHSASASRGAALPSTQAPSPAGSEKAPPIAPVAALVRKIRYPWMVRRLIYVHLLTGIGFVPLFLLAFVISDSSTTSDILILRQTLEVIIGLPFWLIALIIIISMFVHALTRLRKLQRWGWFSVVLGSLLIFLYPFLGLWAFGLVGPTTPAQPTPASQGAKG
jgi:hypothetical protein